MPISAEQWRVSTGLIYTAMPVVSRSTVRPCPWSVFCEVLLYPLLLIMQWWSREPQPQSMIKSLLSQHALQTISIDHCHCYLACAGNGKLKQHSRDCMSLIFRLVVLACLLLLSGDVETNPGPVGINGVQESIQDCMKQFERLTLDIHRCLKNVSVHDFLSAMNTSLSQEQQEFLQKNLLKINASTTIQDIVDELKIYMDCLNYTLLEHIVHKFGDEELKRGMESYVSNLQRFRESTYLCDFVQYLSEQETNKTQKTELHTLVVQVKNNWKECTLEDLEKLKVSIAWQFSLPSFIFIFKTACKGSVVISWLVPEPVATVLREGLEKMRDKEFSKGHQIDRFTIDGQDYYHSPIKKNAERLKALYMEQKRTNLAPIKLAQIEKVVVNRQDMDLFQRASIRGDMDDVRYKKHPLSDNWYPTHKYKRVLIEGAPGVGKTVYSSHICSRWAQGEILSEYSLLVLIPLRDLDNRIKSAQSIFDLFNYLKLQHLLQEVENTHGEGIAMFLDGWDELDEESRERSSIFLNLIKGEVLPKAIVLVTSRPWASKSIRDILVAETDRHVEIITTPKIQLNRVRRNQKNIDYPKFEEFVKSQPAIEATMHTPITADIIAEVFEWSQRTQLTLPTTTTQLYETYVLKVVTQSMHISGASSLSDLQPDVHKQFLSLCGLAYNGIRKQQLVFNVKEVPEEKMRLGLIQTVKQLYGKDGSPNSYNFSHLTVQEFLAAYHISRLSADKQNELVKQHKQSGHFAITLRFLAGLTSLEYLNPALAKQSKPVLDVQTAKVEGKLTVFHWLFEASAGDTDRNVTEILPREGNYIAISLGAHCWTPMDFFVTGYCLGRSNCIWRFEDGVDDDSGLEMLCRGVQSRSYSDRYKGYIEYANFGRSNITIEGLKSFLQLPQRLLCEMNSMQLYYNNLDRTALTPLARAVPKLTSLDELNLNGNKSIGNGGMVELLKALCKSNSPFRILELYNTGIGEKDSATLGELLARNTLEYLLLRDNNLSSDAVTSIMEGVRRNNQLRILDISGSKFTLDSTKSMAEQLQQKECHLKELAMWNCDISTEGAIELAKALAHNRSLRVLRLSENPIGDGGITAFGDVLSRNEHIKVLYLLRCNVSSEIAEKLVIHVNEFRSTTMELAISNSEHEEVFVPTGCISRDSLIQTKNKLDTASSAISTLKHEVQEIESEKKVQSEDQYHDVSVDCIPKLTVLNPLPSQTQTTGWALRGIEICEETTVVVTNSKTPFHWEGYGLKLHFPDGCLKLPLGVEQCSINIKVSLAGQYQFPEDTHLVSAVYWLHCTPRCEFVKAVSIEIPHCSKQDYESTLSIVRSCSTQEKLPYIFEEIQGGVFTKYSSYGLIKRKSFSGHAVIQKRTKERRYYGCVYYLHREIDFVVTWDDKAHREVTRKHYEPHGAIEGPHSAIEFDSDKISLDIPMDGVIVSNFWKVIPLKPPVITKRLVDSHRAGREIPSCQLGVTMIKSPQDIDVKAPDLVLSINLTGAKDPYNKYNILYHPLPADELTSPAQSLSPGLSPSKSPTHYRTLSPKDLGNLLKELLSTVADQWENIGYMLDIEEGRLNIVKEDNKLSQACLREMLKIWLKRDNPPPTSPAIIEAVKALGYESLANDLESKYYLSVYKY